MRAKVIDCMRLDKRARFDCAIIVVVIIVGVIVIIVAVIGIIDAAIVR